MHSPAGIPRSILVVTITLGVLLASGVAALGVLGSAEDPAESRSRAAESTRSGPLALPPVPAPQAGSAACATVLDALPETLLIDDSQVPRRPLVEPAPPATVAWGDARHDPVTLRCGVADPAELTPTSPVVEISGVTWLQLSEAGTTTWFAVDRPVRVALSLPDDAGSGPVQDMSAILREKLPKRDIFG